MNVSDKQQQDSVTLHLQQPFYEQRIEPPQHPFPDQLSGPPSPEKDIRLPLPKRRGPHPLLLVSLVLLMVVVTLTTVLGVRLSMGWIPEPGLAPRSSMQSSSGSAQINAQANTNIYTQYKQLARSYVSHMTLDEELGQLIMVEFADTSYSADLATMINKLHVGGVILYAFQLRTSDQTRHDISEMQKSAFLPLLISTDEEGGDVDRLSNIYGPRMSATEIYQTGNPNIAMQQGEKAAHDLSALGINVNLAPDVDENLVNGYDMVSRTFGDTPQSVISFAGAYLKGLQENGVIGCIKHFPGLGAATADAHTGLPIVTRTKDKLYAVELAPFRAFIQSPDRLENPGMIMPTDVLMPAIDPKYPAELSRIFMTDILRKQFGYDGVVLTDSLYMQGIAQTWDLPTASVLALEAGDDMLLGPTNAEQVVAVVNALKVALQRGTLSRSRIDEAAARIVALKMQYQIISPEPPRF